MLKQFIRWIFFYFPKVSVLEVQKISFWNTVGERMSISQNCRDTSVNRFFPLLILIRDALKKGEKIKEKSQVVPNFTCPLRPKPCSPDPTCPQQGRSRKVKGRKAQDCHQLPDSPRSPPLPCQGGTGRGTGHASLDLSRPQFSTPFSQVKNPCSCKAQDGEDPEAKR